ncbi:Speckle-type POZ protein like [Argiope bruennichi]|uniref:Speckle-type POZ protein like n=1 Tax=Argiope bruennichi TaxID=94029 RepID=A0A8T0EEH1_ARGBR|nr:Speckle-type POZ protein like [Argiope bruennichi]
MSHTSDVSNGFQFIWDVENIDVCFYEESVTSPTFVAHNLSQTEWCMSLRPLIEKDSIMLVLSRSESGCTSESITIDFVVSVSISDGIRDVLAERKGVEFQCGSSESVYWIHHSAKNLYEGDLTVYCHIQKSGKVTLPYISCSARTIIGKEQRHGVWKLPNFKYSSTNGKKRFTLCSTKADSPQVDIFGSLSKKTKSFHIEVQVTYAKPVFIFVKITLLTANGSMKWPTLESYYFSSSTSSHIYEFPLVLKLGYLSRHSSWLLPKGTLTLLCELSISSGMQFSEISESSYLIGNYCKLMHREISKSVSEELHLVTKQDDMVEIQQVSTNSNDNNSTPQTLKDDLKKFYKQKKHCDVILQTENESFPAHTSILCSRSPVFSSMFDHDMKETVNKKVDIVDMDADTLDRFLLFLYSETIEDLQWNRATKLLYAANKYQVDSLKKECSSFLMSHLAASNVCDALVLSDLYQDDLLRSECQDFIFENASEIFSSKEWESFTVDNPLLSAKMLQRYFSLKK